MRQYDRKDIMCVEFGKTFDALETAYSFGANVTEKEANALISDYIAKPQKTKSIYSTYGKKFGEIRESFFCKPCPKVKRVPDYMCDEKYRTLSDDTVDAVNDWLERSPAPVFYKGNDRTEGVSTKTAYSLMTNENEFQWSSKCVQNAIYGMYHRQLACNLYPDANAVQDFTQSVLPWFLNAVKGVNAKLLE